MSLPLRKIFRWLGHIAFVILLAAGTAWAAAAVAFQLRGVTQITAWALLALAAIGIFALRLRKGRLAWAGLAIAALAVAGWYQTIQPLQTRDWAFDVEHGVTGTLQGATVTLQNVRNFNWLTDSTAEAHWESRSYDLDKLNSVDMFTSTWGNPNIAHLIVSFGFTTGEHIAYSVEIRKEKGEQFSSIGGFFRQFEIVLIAANESDVIKLRTNLRGEDVHRFPIKLSAPSRRALFLRYMEFGNELAAKPQFYNTVTANCASTVYHLVQAIKPDMPLDRRLLFSGQLPEYIDELGGLLGDMPMGLRRQQAAISARALAAPAGSDYSRVIRQQN
jgi:Domain of unknown function (DUF4105)